MWVFLTLNFLLLRTTTFFTKYIYLDHFSYLYQFSIKLLIHILSSTELLFYFFIQNRDKTPFPQILFSQYTGYEIFVEKYKRERKAVKPVMALRRKVWTKLQAYSSSSFSSDKNNINGKRKYKSALAPQYPQTIRGSIDNNGLFYFL